MQVQLSVFIKQKFFPFCVKHRLHYPKPRFWMVLSLLTFLGWFWFSLPEPLFQSGYSTVLVDADGQFLSARIATDYQWRFPVSDTVPSKFKDAILCFEDEYFYKHIGVNPVSVGRAIWQNLSHQRIVRGGSTLTMQVIRMSRGNRPRNIFNKLLEMVLAFRLELRCSKEEILNLYASHAPFGGNVVGLEAASWRYFGRSANRLSWGETAALAVLPNAPALIFPGKNHQAYLKKRNRLLEKLCQSNIIDRSTCDLAKSEPLPLKPAPLPDVAPHLLNKCISDGNRGQIIHTTVDFRLQQRAADIAAKYARYYAANYVNNIAVLVLNTQSGEVLAYVGNAHLPDRNNSQYVDNVVSRRSSGSILKPLLYAAMLHEGDMLPASLVSDIPTRIGSYAPENFEKTYDGAVPADVALAHSLNIPAVRELQQYGVDKFYNLLHQVGFTTVNQSPDYYGLSLILGGAEVSLWETTSVYASLGRSLLGYTAGSRKYQSDDYRMSSYRPYHPAATPDATDHSLINAGALWFTFEALSTVNRPWEEIGWDYFASMHKIGWKTGTSFGQRDAWAVGVTPQYTIGVWVGNSTGEGRPGLTGVSYAAPVMFEIFKSLSLNRWFKEPTSDLVRISVCKQSGYRATGYCDAENRWVPRLGVKVKACSFHLPQYLDVSETHRVTGNCYPVSSMHIVPWFVLPPAQEYFYKRNHPEYRQLPPYAEGCEPPKEHVLDILSPDNNSAIYIPKGLDDAEGKLIFEAVHRNPEATLFWHLDGDYITSTKGDHKIELSPSVGRHRLVVEDEAGNMMKRTFRILSK